MFIVSTVTSVVPFHTAVVGFVAATASLAASSAFIVAATNITIHADRKVVITTTATSALSQRALCFSDHFDYYLDLGYNICE